MEHISCLYQAAGGVFQALLALVPASPDKCAGLKQGGIFLMFFMCPPALAFREVLVDVVELFLGK